jgi:alpha-ketoglutarate-dependent taurine dioxygenase
VTNAETGFHTDNSFGDSVLDYVGLLCLHDAREGGLSQLISGYTVYNELAERDPDELAVLRQPFHVDRRGGVRPGEGPTVRVPVIERKGTELTYRYLRYWIHSGHDKAGEPLTPAQARALEALEAVLARPEFRLEFPLRPGQMLFTNNRWLLHNRTAFQDYSEPERKRHLVRLWLART